MNSSVMAMKVQDRKDDATGFLDPPYTKEWPFSVELVQWKTLGSKAVCNLTLTCVIAFRGTIPQQKT
jgi:hypothetical protein